jgi:hypothetical protein
MTNDPYTLNFAILITLTEKTAFSALSATNKGSSYQKLFLFRSSLTKLLSWWYLEAI